MSLLLDARKKSGVVDSKFSDFSEMQLENDQVAPARQSNAQADSMRATGENLFAAKTAPFNKRHRLSISSTALIVGGILAAGGGYYIHLKTTPHDGHDHVVARDNETRGSIQPPNRTPSAEGGSKESLHDSPVIQPIYALKPVVVAPVSAVLALNSPDVAPRRPTAEKTFATIPGTGKPAFNKSAPRGANVALAKTLDIQHEPESDTIDSILALAYKAYQKGDYASANQRYREAFAIAPKNRDALLGLAVIAQRQEQDDAALHYYLQVLLLDPRDPVAHAGMASFGRGDTVTKESRLKQLISQQPDAAALHFVLGHQYADQARWSDAQQAYFNALAMEPGNALFAFNLAISLDHLGQRKAAAKYYQQAILFDPSGNSGFSRTQTLQRLNELTASDQ